MIQLPSYRYILPNLVTLTATFCGFSMILLSVTGEYASSFYLAAALVPIACVVDGFDGRVARMVHGESEFGTQLDSLSDMVTFGVGPAFLGYFWGLHHLGPFGKFVAFAFLSCAMMRLARFNIGANEGRGADRYFEGLPAPMGGMGLAAVVGLQSGWLGQSGMNASSALWFGGYALLLALLMVSPVPFRSFKDLRLTPMNALFVGTVLSVVTVVSVVIDPVAGISMAFFGYLFSNLIGALLFSHHRRASVPTAEDTWEEDEESRWT